jgi:dipeptidyl aminopeptidase/acylaminoacyl peptidase
MLHTRRFVPAIVPVLLVAFLAGAPRAAAPVAGNGTRFVSEYDLFKFVWIADPQISPDGKQVAFVRVVVNKKREGYDTALWIVPTSGGEAPRVLTIGPRDSSPRWSPDGQQLAFVRAPEEDGKPQPAQIFLLSMSGGEARQVTRLAKGAGAPHWSPDGKRLAFTSTTIAKDSEKAPSAPTDGSDPAAEQKARKSDVRVITRAAYRANGGGYLDASRHTAIWTIAVNEPDAKPTRITKGDFDVTLTGWSEDGRDLYLTSTRIDEAYYDSPHRELYRVPADAHEADPSPLVKIDGVIADAELSPDGKSVAFEGTARPAAPRSYNQPDLFVASLAAAAPSAAAAKSGSGANGAAATSAASAATAAAATASARNLTDTFDFDIGGGISGDQHAPRGSLPASPIWLDAHRVLTVAAREGRADLTVVNVDDKSVKPLTTGAHEVMAFTASRNASQIVALVSTTTSIGDLYMVNRTSGELTRITQVNKTFENETRLTEPEQISYPSFDGKKIQAWVQKPPDFDKAKKYPLILNIHGGPHAAYGETFFHEMQLMAARGYVVLYPNPRGSTSYGQDFGNIIQYHYPGDDYKDLMAGVDELIRQGYIDEKRLGVTGGSGGGLLTNWVVTQTPRFAAAVSMRSIADWAGFWYTADFTLFQKTWFKGAPWEAPEDFSSRSPITYVTKIKTPMMFIEGEQDFRTPPADGGEQLFRALKYLHIPTTMVQFPGESHELSRSGQPWHRVERLQQILSWFDKYLQGRTPQESAQD